MPAIQQDKPCGSRALRSRRGAANSRATMILRLVLILLAIGATLAACRTTTSTSPSSAPNAVITRTAAVRAWEVWSANQCVGSVVRYEDPTDATRAFYAVRNTSQQDLGVVDLEGRAWRYQPHARDAEWLGTGTVAQGVARILHVDGACTLKEVAVESLSRLDAPATPR